MDKKKGNNYIIDTENNIAKIEITRRNKESIWALIDLEDLERVINFPYTWSAKYDTELKQNYVETTIYCGFENGKKLGKSLKLHKFIMDVNDNRVVDHINHDPRDNRKENLRVILPNENLRNREGRNKNNHSGYRNVSWNGNGWSVQLQVDGKTKCIKRFKKNELEEAGKYAEQMRQELYGEFAGNN